MIKSAEAAAPVMLPAAVGLTHLRVYDTPAPDGLVGGSPHLHFACTECYYVERGRGHVQTLCASGYAETLLEPGAVVWFSPGVIHRLINEGDLEIFVVMQNSGLPESGDFVLTMPETTIADADSYFEAASLSPGGEVFAGSLAAAYRRRDLAVDGFAALRIAFDSDGLAALDRFYGLAARLVQSKIEDWERIWRSGAAESAAATERHLDNLRRGDLRHLFAGAVRSMPPPSARRLGMCGRLGVYLPEGVSDQSAAKQV